MLSFMKIVILATLQSLALSFNIPLDARQINSIIESSEQGTTVSNNVQVTFEGYVLFLSIYPSTLQSLIQP